MAQEKKESTSQAPSAAGEAAGRERGYQDKGGHKVDDVLEDGQLRGVDEDGQVVTGMHGGPDKAKPKEPPTSTSSRPSPSR